MRLDKYLVEKSGLTRNRAQFIISEGLVKCNSKVITKNSYDVQETDVIEIAEDKKTSFVARSAIKLDDFLDLIELDVGGMTCLDVGASTGGFTQVLLERGAQEVIAVDVGSSQLHPKIKDDSRVTSLENTDIRKLDLEGKKINLITVDVSFISLSKIIESLISLSDKNTRMILLFKPQFEVGKVNLKKTGLPKDMKSVISSLDRFKKECKEKGLKIMKINESTLPGEAGNLEFFIYLSVDNAFL